MLKKFLAGLTALALSLGMVVLTAGPASAHHSTITATVACTSPTAATITWSVQNWNGGKTGQVQSSTGNLVPALTEFASNETKQYTQNITSTGTYNLSVTMKWWDGDSWENQTTNSGSIKVKSSDFSGCELPDDTDDKIEICHATASDSNPYTTPEVSKSSIITLDPNGHATHADDIIPPFSYIKQGVPGAYPGQNWDAYGQAVYAADCDYPDVKPAAPTFTNAQCTGPGTYGQASYTIPGTANVVYKVSINDGSWTVKSAGTYFVNVGTKVEVHAEAADGYKIDGTDDWSKTFTAPDCDADATPTKPTIVQAVCTGEGQVGDGTFTIPAITGIQYKVWDGNSWENIAAGDHSAGDGDTVLIRAYPISGYDLTDHDHNKEYKSYTLNFDNIISSKCDVPATPTFTAQVCTGPGSTNTASYTIPDDSGIQYQVRINGGSWQDVSDGTVNVVVFPRLIEVQALADGHIIVSGSTTYWSYNFTSAGDCLVDAFPVEPDFTDSICEPDTTGKTQGTYEVIAATNVTYEISTDGGNTWAPVSVGVHNANPGDSVIIRAVAEAGYELENYTGPWSHDFTDPGDCLDDATATPATDVDQTCEVGEGGVGSFVSGYLVIPNSPNVEYFIDGSVIPAVPGQVAKVPGTYTVTAAAMAGYQLVGYTGPWELTIVAAEPCGDLIVLPDVTPSVSFKQTTCSASGSYTLGLMVDDDPAGVIWTVSGGLPNTLGTHSVTTPGTVNITATAALGFGLSGDDDGVMQWSFDYAGLPDDCLPTLALTGGSIAASGLGLGALLTLGGILVFNARKRDQLVNAE